MLNVKLLSHAYFFPSLPFNIFLSSLSHTVLSTLLILAVCRTRVTTNSVNMTSLATSLPVAQWLERPTSVREVTGSIPVGDSDFFLCPTLVTNWIFHLSYFFPSLTFNIFLSSFTLFFNRERLRPRQKQDDELVAALREAVLSGGA